MTAGSIKYLLVLFLIIGLEKFGVAEFNAGDVWQKPISVQWLGTPLGESLNRLAETRKIGLMIDRRLDPSTSLHFESTNQPLGQILQQLALSLDKGCVLFDSTVYFGTKDTVEILPGLLAAQQNQLEKLPPRRAAVFRRKMSLHIPFLSEPKEILKKLATQNALQWKNPEILPHDLWNEKSLNNLSLNELLTILLIGFEMTYEIEGEGEILVVVPLSKQKSNPFTSQKTEILFEKPEHIVQNVQEVQNVQKIQEVQKVSKNQTPKVPLAQRRFTLKAENQPLNTLLQSLSDRLDLKLKLDEKSFAAKGVLLDSRVSFDVKNVTAAQLFRAILRPLKLDFRIKEETLLVW
jgi:hypothetical protein